MPRKPQFGSIYKRGNIYWIKYSKDSTPQYESSGSPKYADAQNLLDQRRAQIFSGTHLDSKARRVTASDLLDSLERDYKINGKDHQWAERVLRKHLRPAFAGWRAAKIKYETVERYIEQRQSEGAANATINRELSLLHRAFTLGREAGRVTVVPTLPKKLKENNVRKGFFERDQFVAMRAALPPDVKPVMTFAYWTGCRKGEILSLVWPQVDLSERVVRLEPGETKNDEARVIPLVDELFEILKLQKAIRDERWPACPWVFFRHGKRIKDFRKAWEQASKAAGVIDDEGDPARLFHDLRRTGVRNLIRAGVPERVAMMISGHKTRSVFDRYNIVSERDLHEAGRRLNAYIREREFRTGGDKTVIVGVQSENPNSVETGPKLLN
jgi:integrase